MATVDNMQAKINDPSMMLVMVEASALPHEAPPIMTAGADVPRQ
jgi:hypothetical protein